MNSVHTTPNASLQSTPALTHWMQALETQFAYRLVHLPAGGHVGMRESVVRLADDMGHNDATDANNATDAGNATDVTLVLLHGISSNAASWLPVVMSLREQGCRMRIVAWDAPGYGASSALTSTHPVAQDYAHVLQQWLTVLSVKRCVLVGHSLGCLMAGAWVQQYGRKGQQEGRPEVLGVMLISPAGGYAHHESHAREKVRNTRLQTLQEMGIQALAKRTAQRLLSVHAHTTAHAWVEHNAAQLRMDGYTQAVHMLCDSDLQDSVAAIVQAHRPVHVYCGEHDEVTPVQPCREWAQRLHASFNTFPQAAHASPVEQPQQVAGAMLQFFQGIDKGMLA